MSAKLIHTTHEGSHLYKFVGMYLKDIDRLRADGAPIDTSWIPPQPHGAVDRFFKFDHEVKTWTMVQSHDRGRFVSNGLDVPFKMVLPEEFESKVALTEFAVAAGLAMADGDGDVFTNLLERFYRWEPNIVEEDHPYEFEERNLGEFTPCPEVDFLWRPIQPHEVGIPYEMWHLGPVRVEKAHLWDLFFRWVEKNKKDLCIKSFYPKQDGAVFFEVNGIMGGHLDLTKDPDFIKLLGDVTGKDLSDLQLNLAVRMTALQEMLVSVSPVHQCPRCKGGGALPCPRCNGIGMTDKGKLAEAAVTEALFKVRQIKGSRGDDNLRSAIHAVENLARYFLPGDVEE